MGKSIPVTLGRFTFPSKKEANRVLRDLRDKYLNGGDVLDEDDTDLLLGVVFLHPQATEKIGAGVSRFYVAKAPDHATQCFYLGRLDNTYTDFSWKETISPTTQEARLQLACRNAIKDQKTAFKDQAWPFGDQAWRTCPITQKQYGRDRAHVDHEPPTTFKMLVTGWLQHAALSVDTIQIIHTGDLRSEDAFGDDGQRESWRDFHASQARLRVVSAEGNLIQGSRELAS